MGTEVYFYNKKKHKKGSGEILNYGDILIKLHDSPAGGEYLKVDDFTTRVCLSNSNFATKICDILQKGDKLQQIKNGFVCEVFKLESNFCLLESNGRKFSISYLELYTDIYKGETIIISNNMISLMQKFKRGNMYIQDSNEVMYLRGWSDVKMKFMIKARNARFDWDYHKMEEAIKRGIITEFKIPEIGSSVICHSTNSSAKIVSMDSDTILFDSKEIETMNPLIFFNNIKSKFFEVFHKIPIKINIVSPEIKSSFSKYMEGLENRIGVLDHHVNSLQFKPFKSIDFTGSIDPSGKNDHIDAMSFAMQSAEFIGLKKHGILPIDSFAESREKNREEFLNEEGISARIDNVTVQSKSIMFPNEAWECPFKLPLFSESNIVGKSQKEKIKENIQQSY